MGKGTQPKSERNEMLGIDYQRKNADGSRYYSMGQLVAKYDISAARIYIILKALNIPVDRPKNNIEKFNSKRKS